MVLGAEGIPIAATLTINGTAFDVEPLAWSPVLLVGPDGREAGFPRGLAASPSGAAITTAARVWVDRVQPTPGLTAAVGRIVVGFRSARCRRT